MKKMKNLVWAVAVVCVFLSSLAVGTTVEAAPKNSIVFEKKSITMYAGEVKEQNIKTLYQNGSKKYVGKDGWGDNNVQYSKAGVVTVSKSGKITAKKKGTVTVTVRNVYDSKVKGTFKVVVKAKPKKVKLTLNSSKQTLAVGKTYTLKTKLTGISEKGVTFKSGNKSIATVDKKGKVTAKKAGSTTITVTSKVNPKAKASFKVTVRTADTVGMSYSSKGKASIVLKETKADMITFRSYVDDDSSSEKKHVFDINNVNYKSSELYKDFKASYSTAIPHCHTHAYKQISIKSIKGLKSNAVVYKSSNKSVATVSKTGLVKALRPGTAVITVSSKVKPSVKATYTVKVEDQHFYIDSIDIYDYYIVGYFDDTWVDDHSEEYLPVTYSGYYNLGNCVITSSNPEVARVWVNQDGETGLAIESEGKTTITVQSRDGKSLKYRWTMTVEYNPNKGFGAFNTLCVGDKGLEIIWPE